MTLAKRKGLFTDFFDNERFFDIFPKELVNRTPSVNIIENGKKFKIELSAPGLKKGDFQIDIDNNILTISAEKEEDKEEENEQFTKREFSYSSFSRSFILPESVDNNQVKAKYEDGLLKIDIEKKEDAKQSRKKQVKVS
ncbi:MAG: Hsp20/alpha crystallin family protein [Daejeonella sp.]|uniref:Hsp20/alpha crystallin family protein n=1 Tax=Daejeonella sp. TaxID=2805397 RepID=UPI00273673B2|nr:Hsp20/alpha crystallin family protein [Daejeonella sp.]MDP3469753.1 Hsp20/alpha crystallin family protein [Daejeonella sp.]